MSLTAIVNAVDSVLTHHSTQLELSPTQRARARSLAITGALASLFGTTPRDLLTLLEPAFDAHKHREAAELRDATEGRR